MSGPDVAVDFAREDVERHRSRAQHDVVEFARRELGAERLARVVAQFEDRSWPIMYAQAWPGFTT